MDEKQLQTLANELAKNLKTPEDLNQFDRLLKKISVEAALKPPGFPTLLVYLQAQFALPCVPILREHM